MNEYSLRVLCSIGQKVMDDDSLCLNTKENLDKLCKQFNTDTPNGNRRYGNGVYTKDEFLYYWEPDNSVYSIGLEDLLDVLDEELGR
jgi:hypothetical protein